AGPVAQSAKEAARCQRREELGNDRVLLFGGIFHDEVAPESAAALVEAPPPAPKSRELLHPRVFARRRVERQPPALGFATGAGVLDQRLHPDVGVVVANVIDAFSLMVG